MPGEKESHNNETGVSIATSTVGGDVVGRDKITTNIVNYNYYPSQDLQVGYLPPSVQFELVDHKDELRQALAGLKARQAVLLWGIGGVGKTNLAAHAAYAAVKGFKDGVIWIQAGGGDIFALCDGLARALGDSNLPRLPTSEKVDAARRLLAGRKALLVLDDVRQKKTLQESVNLCPPTVGLLATSRQNLAAFRIRIELKPLSHPQARLLFCQRADLPESMADDPAVEAICREWGGYPFGIVLTAARKVTEQLPLERLAEHLRQINLPEGRPTYISPEFNEVHALLEDHFQPLASAELSLLNLIASSFGKSISLAILARAAQLPELDTETVVGNLVKVQLVVAYGGRYSLHDVIRDALLLRLPQAELARLRLQFSKNLELYLTEKMPFDGRWCIAPPAMWHELEPDFENCLGAVRWCLTHSHVRLGWNLFRLVDYPLGNLGYWDQEDEICKEVIAAAGDLDVGQTAWWKVNILGFTYWMRNEPNKAKALAQEAMELFVAANDRIGIAEVQLFTANTISSELDDPITKKTRNYEKLSAQARDLFEKAIATFEALDDKRNLARAFGDFAEYWFRQPEIALPYCQRSIELYTELNEEEGLALAQPSLCSFYTALGEYAKAEALLEPMREAVRKLGRPDITPQVDWAEAELREKQGDQFARKNKRKACAVFRRGLAAATRGRNAFARMKMPLEVNTLRALERRLRRKIAQACAAR